MLTHSFTLLGEDGRVQCPCQYMLLEASAVLLGVRPMFLPPRAELYEADSSQLRQSPYWWSPARTCPSHLCGRGGVALVICLQDSSHVGWVRDHGVAGGLDRLDGILNLPE